ncbi:hypothetical protein PINS_up003560 [Pythium insidiosum]|nr:hypothetical protein PINS_up003560 [Pythium insidiosum]
MLENADIDAVEVDDGSDDASSVASSPMSATRDDDDTFETWLHEAQAASKQLAPVIQYLGADTHGSFTTVPESLPVTDERTESFSHELAEWLRRERSTSLTSSSVDLARSVQQIEDDIRAALDSAASRVAQELHRRDLFEQELRAASAGDSEPAARRDDVAYSHRTEPAIESTLGEPSDLLLLMDVVIGDGRSETIEVRVGDHPESLAAAFATKHGLAAESVPRLTQHIEEQLDALAAEMAEEAQVQALQRSHPISDHCDAVSSKPTRDPEQLSTTTTTTTTTTPSLLSDDVASSSAPPTQQIASPQAVERRQREFEREHKYNTLMERYGHYTSHSGKVESVARCSDGAHGDPDAGGQPSPVALRRQGH